jgi:predicted transposase/invertase (TIGR01784 family)
VHPTVHTLLDPTSDIVFKLLFTRDEDSDTALRGLLTAVLAPPRPIAVVRILNAAVGGIDVDDKTVALDLSLELVDGTKLDLEMQVRKEDNFRNRALLYWAKLFGGQLERGGSYARLRPAISILFLGYSELPGDRLHSIFHILEAHDHQRLTDAFEMHIIELPKLRGPAGGLDPSGDTDAALLRWSRFFAADTDEALKAAAMSDPAIQKAHAVLERLSADPEVRLLAQRRELAQQAYRLEMTAVRDEALSHARAAILDVCELLGVTPTEEQRAELERLDGPGLDALRARLKKERRWA